MTQQELLAKLKKLEEENAALLANLEEEEVFDVPSEPVGVTIFGTPRAPLTDEERERFRKHNQRFKYVEASKENNQALAVAAKLHNLHQKNEELRKKVRRG